MNFSIADLRYLRWSLCGLAFGLLVGGSAIWLGNLYLEHARKKFNGAQVHLNEASQALGGAQSDRKNMALYATEYSAILERKIIADEQRLSWMEEIKRLEQRYHLYDLKYTIAPQRAFPHATDSADIDIRLSELGLQMNLLHEVRLIDFLRDLHSESAGKLIIERCSLERDVSNENLPPENIRFLLKADCTGGWITLKHRSSP